MTAQEKKVLASEILSYLLKNPDAGDTLEGIAQFWRARQRVDLRLSDVQDAVARLVAEGLVKVRLSRSSGTRSAQRYYQLNPLRKNEIASDATRKPVASKRNRPRHGGGH